MKVRVGSREPRSHDRTGIRVDTARNVEREDRSAERIEFFDEMP